jgi:hypothetical protein
MRQPPILLRPGRATRGVAATLAGVFLTLSVAAGFHRGDHDDLGWLPSRFHHHHFELRAETEAAPLPFVDHCLACHVSRTLVRFASSAPPLPVSVTGIERIVRHRDDAPVARGTFPRSSRAPPA